MARYRVVVPLLNQRKFPVEDTDDKNNVVGVVNDKFEFEGELALTNKLGDWYKDVAENFYWGGGVKLSEIKKSFQWFQDLKIENIWNLFNEKGDRTTVAILDSGYDTSNSELPAPLLSKLFVNNPSNTATIEDKIGHGTFCTSLVASRNKVTIVGVAPLCTVLVGKVSLKGELQDVNIILDGIEWAINSGAEIISISMGLPLQDQNQINQLQQRLNTLTGNKNVLIFSACGDSDSGQIISKEYYPASLDNCISVGTVKNNMLDNVTVRSNKTIIHTLGVDIEGYALNSIITKKTGTSMSVPIVAGIAALAVSFLKKRNNGQWSKQEVLQKMIQTAGKIDGFTEKKIIDPLKFFQAL